MNISNESLLKILAVAAVAYFLLSGSSTKPKPEKFMYQPDGLGLVVQSPSSYIRTRQGQGPFNETNHIRMRETNPYLGGPGYTGNIRTNPAPIANIMNSSYIGHHIRRDRRNNMLNSMMRGTDDDSITGLY